MKRLCASSAWQRCVVRGGARYFTGAELTNEQKAIIAPLIPKRKPSLGRPRTDNRRTLNGILYVLKTGCAWADMPREYGSSTTY